MGGGELLQWEQPGAHHQRGGEGQPVLEALSGNLAFFLQEEAEEFEEVLEEVDEEMVPTASWQSFQFRSKCTACVGNDGHCRHNLSVPASLPSHLAAEVGEACAFLQVACSWRRFACAALHCLFVFWKAMLRRARWFLKKCSQKARDKSLLQGLKCTIFRCSNLSFKIEFTPEFRVKIWIQFVEFKFKQSKFELHFFEFKFKHSKFEFIFWIQIQTFQIWIYFLKFKFKHSKFEFNFLQFKFKFDSKFEFNSLNSNSNIPNLNLIF